MENEARYDWTITRRRATSRVNLFCHVNPAQKNRIIFALKLKVRVVGYLGDGIGRAGIPSGGRQPSVSTAVGVAKEAADLILLKRDLHLGVTRVSSKGEARS